MRWKSESDEPFFYTVFFYSHSSFITFDCGPQKKIRNWGKKSLIGHIYFCMHFRDAVEHFLGSFLIVSVL